MESIHCQININQDKSFLVYNLLLNHLTENYVGSIKTKKCFYFAYKCKITCIVMMKNCFFLEWLTEKQLASISRRDPFLTAIWPSYGQLWDIFEGTAHSLQGGSSTPFLRHPPLDPACPPPPLLKTFVSPPLCSIAPPFKVF